MHSTRTCRTGAIVLTLITAAATTVRAEEPSPITFHYPELLVTPRASARLETEAKRETKTRWSTHLPLQASALTTLFAGTMQLSNKNPVKDPDGYSGITGVATGAGWLAITLWLSASHEPYADGASEISAMPHKSDREELARERAAEESIHRAAALGQKLRWLSVISNVAASTYMLSNSVNQSFSRTVDAAALVMAFTPLVFPNHWTVVAEEQQNYKKRIYGPITEISGGAALLADTRRSAPGAAFASGLTPGVQLSLHF